MIGLAQIVLEVCPDSFKCMNQVRLNWLGTGEEMGAGRGKEWEVKKYHLKFPR
jgi:hypothetical protein